MLFKLKNSRHASVRRPLSTAAFVAESAPVTNQEFSREFNLVATCCRWPVLPLAVAAIRKASAGNIDWPHVFQLAVRHRVIGLVQNALTVAAAVVPSDVVRKFESNAAQIAQRNLFLVGETMRLQKSLLSRHIPVVVLKGAGLAQLAYGSLQHKHIRDIDLLVPMDRAMEALRQLEGEGYSLVKPAAQLSDTQRQAFIQYGKEVELAHFGTKMNVELQWRAAVNPFLLKGIDANSPTQEVSKADGLRVRTFADEDLFAYLSVHGACHEWFRLKWLADINALISHKDDANLIGLYRHAQEKGAGLCAGQGLLLCQQLLGKSLPATLRDELAGDRKLHRLTAIALRALAETNVERGQGWKRVTRGVLNQFLLGQGWSFFTAQCRIALVGLPDVIRLSLPAFLHFLYPIIRLPLLLGRRFKYRG